MIGAVIQGGLQPHQGIAGQHALVGGLPQALFHGGEEVLGDAAAEDLFGEDHVLGLILGLKADPHVAELAGAAGLLLVAAMGLHLFLDGLPIGDPGGTELRLHPEAAL